MPRVDQRRIVGAVVHTKAKFLTATKRSADSLESTSTRPSRLMVLLFKSFHLHLVVDGMLRYGQTGSLLVGQKTSESRSGMSKQDGLMKTRMLLPLME